MAIAAGNSLRTALETIPSADAPAEATGDEPDLENLREQLAASGLL